ncbi:hypothetical protein Cni_G05521 [Canna indica]|uniref:Uncharacterized protein n=1 Tax=Canna indica TaxID=4628 RepID=A0AAQ3JV27_9LILI|nr:hypothetical protein Cni_G05521 [Canna indica]
MADLIQDGKWDVSILSHCFGDSLKDKILCIHLPIQKENDKWIWAQNEKGALNSKVAYNFPKEMNMPQSTQTYNSKKLWNASVTPKAKEQQDLANLNDVMSKHLENDVNTEANTDCKSATSNQDGKNDNDSNYSEMLVMVAKSVKLLIPNVPDEPACVKNNDSKVARVIRRRIPNPQTQVPTHPVGQREPRVWHKGGPNLANNRTLEEKVRDGLNSLTTKNTRGCGRLDPFKALEFEGSCGLGSLHGGLPEGFVTRTGPTEEELGWEEKVNSKFATICSISSEMTGHRRERTERGGEQRAGAKS